MGFETALIKQNSFPMGRKNKVGVSLVAYKMVSKINLNNRNAFEITNILRNFDGAVYIEKASEHRRANTKSLLGLLSLGICGGDEVNIVIDNTHGEHERVLRKMKSILENESKTMKGGWFMEKLPPITEDKWNQVNEFNRFIWNDFMTNSTELSPETLKAYYSNLRIWFVWVLDDLGNKKQTDIKPLDFKRFQNWMIGRGCSSSDISSKRSAVSSLNNYIDIYYREDYPAFRNFVNKSIKKPEKAAVHEKVPPNKAELQMMIDTLEASTRKNKKELIAYLKFTFETGCRRAETRQILKNIVDTPAVTKMVKMKDKNGVEVKKKAKYYLTPKIRCKGKGVTGKIRQLKFSDYSMDSFREWLSARGEDENEFMFVVRYGGVIKQVEKETFNNWATTIFEPILGRRFHPHALREAAATVSVIEEGKSIEAVKALLGHESSVTTRGYVCGLDDEAEADELFV